MNAAYEFDILKNRLTRPEKEIEMLGHALNGIPMDRAEIMIEMRADCFSDNTNKLLFILMQDLFRTGHDLTLDTLYSFIDLKAKNHHEQSLMKEKVFQIEGVKLTESLFNSISLLNSLSQNRKIYHEILVRGQIMFQNNEPIEGIVSHMFKILGDLGSRKKEIPLSEITSNAVDAIIDPSAKPLGLLTGIDEFDLLTGGVKEDRYYTFAGESGAGKTALVIDLIDRLCERYSSEIAILFLSLEMSEDRVLRRLISRHTNLTEHQLEARLKPLHTNQKAAIKAAGEKIKLYPLEIVYQSMNCQDITLRMKKFALENPGKHLMVFLDHIGLVVGETSDQRVNTIQASTIMKSFCRDHNGSVFVLSQFTKEIDSNVNRKNYHRPHIGYIMESGRIRQDSDFVGLIWRPETRFRIISYDGNDEWVTAGKMLILNEKNRDGQCPSDMILNHNVACNRLINSVDIFN